MSGVPIGCDRWWWLVYSHARAALCGSVLMVASPGFAHDIYSGLTSKTGAACCDGHDCRAAHHRSGSLGLEMLVSGTWVRIRDDEIQYRTLDGDSGDTNGSHWCGGTFPLLGIVTYCAILPPRSASITAQRVP